MSSPIFPRPVADLLQLRLDFGLRSLLPQWRRLLRPDGLRRDLFAALTVACVAIPLSLAIAVASEVPPAHGLTTAIVASLVVPWFNGTPLAVSGPAAALAVLVGTIVEQHGISGLVFATVAAGALQLATGALGLGRFVLLVPSSVVHGFTAGIGAIIILQQLPRALGFPAPDESHIWAVTSHLGERAGTVNPWALATAATAGAAMFFGSRSFPRVPAALLAVGLLGVAAHQWSLPLELLGPIPSELPTPSWPALPTSSIGSLLGDAVVLYAVVSLETLLSSAAVDRLSGSGRHDPDQELIGQGLGNLSSAAFGGLPVTGVIARSGLNVVAGARTRRAAFLHALVLLAAVYLGSAWMAGIPMAALAGILLAVGVRMADPRVLLGLLRTSRLDAVTYAVTFLTIVIGDLLAGIQAGMSVAVVLLALRLGQSGTHLEVPVAGPVRVVFGGPLTFVASVSLADVALRLRAADLRPGLLLDLRAVRHVDASGVDAVHDMIAQARRIEAPIAVLGPAPEVRHALMVGDPIGDIESMIAASASDVATLLRRDGDGRLHLTLDLDQRRRELARERPDLLLQLRHSQKPHSVFITCADSRVVPALITGTDPGEIFVMRSIGAIVPRTGQEALVSEQAGLWYAIEVLGVRDVVVCGHSNCGAARALWGHDQAPDRGPLARWLAAVRGNVGPLSMIPEHDEVARQIVHRQLENLRSHAFIREREAQGQLTLHAWFYDVSRAEVLEWNEAQAQFLPVRSTSA